MTLQQMDSGSVLLYALYIAEHLLLCFECEILVYVVRETASYIKIECLMLCHCQLLNQQWLNLKVDCKNKKWN